MYKKIKYNQLTKLKTNFFKNIQNIYKRQWHTYLKPFLRKSFKEGNTIYFFKSNKPILKISKIDKDKYEFCDEKEKIQTTINKKDINNLHNLLKNNKKISKQKKSNQSILNKLLDELKSNDELKTIQDKPYLVYDIETPPIMGDLEQAKFVMAYSFLSNDDHSNSKLKYKYVSEDNLKKFVDFMLDFDGRIIWYNHTCFDNPVCAYNLDYDDKQIEKLNEKSLDLFMFLRNLTWRRVGLDKVATALIDLKKTLNIADEGAQDIQKYLQTNDQKHLKSVKKYCKNDVKMTLWVLLYLIKYKSIYINNTQYEYSIPEFIKKANHIKKPKKEQKKSIKNAESIF